MSAPETLADATWWVLSGAIFISAATCALLLKLLLNKLDAICVKLDRFDKATSEQDKAIVEIQTRCAFHHGVPIKNTIAAYHQ
jgi:hypothetical protein